MDKNQHCPCGTNKEFARCCKPYIVGDSKPDSPESLMRSRYSAYATKHYAYIVNTQAPMNTKASAVTLDNTCQSSNSPEPGNARALTVLDVERASENTLWCKLEVLSTFEHEGRGEVEFIAYHKTGKEFFAMHELSRFSIAHGKWLYENGDMLHKSGIVKPGRNDSCLCGSGKKFKQCCLHADA